MAALNMQQTVLSQAPGSEQPQEEVQLTELLPVKQSRIRENGIFKNVDVDVDAEGTDALKVLRSFATSEEEQFQLRNFTFCGKFERQEKQGKDKQPRKPRKDEAGNVDDSAGNEKLDDGTFDGDTIKGKRKTIAKRSAARVKPAKKKLINVNGGGKEAEERQELRTSQTDENAFGRGLKVALSGYNEPMFLDLDKGKDFSDEIYVFRREPVDSNATLDPHERAGSENAESYEHGYSSTDGTLFDSTISPRETSKNDSSREDSDTGRKTKLQESVNESSLNIGAIIEANYLLESENNNVLRSRSKVRGLCASSLSLDTSNDESSSRRNESISREDVCDGEAASSEGQHKKYCCVVCEARFKGSGGLRNHYKIVHGAGPVFKCDECGKEFPLKERLKLHVRTHTGFKPYKCPECDKSFARGGQLVQHRRTHSQVKPYRCGLCSGTFTCAANLALHVKRHNGQKDHKCEIDLRARVRASGRAEEAPRVPAQGRQVLPLRHLQQDVQGPPSPAHEDARARPTARVRHVRPEVRAEVPADGSPKNALRSEALQVSGLLAGVRSFHCPQAAHAEAYRRETVQMRGVQRRLHSAAPLEEAHEVYPRKERAVRLQEVQELL